MSYRDDRDADQARIAALEGELASAKVKIAELEGKQSQALVVASKGALAPGAKSAAVKWAGAPLQLELRHTFDGVLPADKFEDLVNAIREITGDRGRTELMKTSMSWWTSSSEKSTGPFTSVTLQIKDGKTTLVVGDKLGQLAGAIYGGIGGGVGGGALLAPVAATIAMPILAPLVFGVWLGGGYLGCRALFKSRARKRAQKLQQTFDQIKAAVEQELAVAAPPPSQLSPVEQANRLDDGEARARDRANDRLNDRENT